MPDARIRHKPEKTVLYAEVRDHLNGFLRAAREHGALPAFIEKTFRAFLKCGIPEHGFIRVHCAYCGHHNIVAFSCKRRGVCASCSARAMGDGAAHLVDQVLPKVPYRQRVVGFPFELNGPLAFQPGFLIATERMVVDPEGNTVLVLSPTELLARLCSLIPAPGHPTRKYFGKLAGGSKDRKLVVPKATHRKRAHAHPDHVTPTASPVKWAELLKRVWGIDALKCPTCDGRMTALAVVEDAAEVARYLAHTGQATVYQRAQAPPDLAA